MFSSLNTIPYPGTATGLTGAFARSVRQISGNTSAGDGVSAAAWSGYRNLTLAEIDALAIAMVAQVRTRAPFVSLADFMNRRLEATLKASKAHSTPPSIRPASTRASGEEITFERDFAIASDYITSGQGYISHSLSRCEEKRSRYMLLANWESMEAHAENFRKSDQYLEWKRLIHHYYDSFPTVEHYSKVYEKNNGE